MRNTTFHHLRTTLTIVMLCMIAIPAGAQPRISIFFDHVAEMSRQQHIPLRDAAQLTRQLGYEGIDVRFTIEHFGAPSMLDYAKESIANVRAAWPE